MPTILKIIIITLIILIIGIIAYIVYLYQKEKKQENQTPKPKEKPQKEIKIQIISNPVKEWEKNLLVQIAKERLLRIQSSTKIKKLDINELEILSKIIEKKDEIIDWNTLKQLTKNEKTYGVLNIAILDHLYVSLPQKEKTDEVVKTAYLLDIVNNGITKKVGEKNYLPENLDINASLINILNNDLESENRTNKLSPQTIKRACVELASNGGYKNLNWAAKQVISRLILDIIGNVVYNPENIQKLLSDENKIYLRLLTITIANKDYSSIVEDFYLNS